MIDNQLGTVADELASSAKPSADAFSERGFRKLCLHMLADAVFTIAKNPDSEEAIEQEIWLKGNCKSAFTAQMCIEGVSTGLNIDGRERLYRMTIEDPQGTARLMRHAMENFERIFDAPTEQEELTAQYRAQARPH